MRRHSNNNIFSAQKTPTCTSNIFPAPIIVLSPQQVTNHLNKLVQTLQVAT